MSTLVMGNLSGSCLTIGQVPERSYWPCFYYNCNHKKLLQFMILQIFSCLADNPYDAADKWLLKENLPFAYRQQIVEFILQNSGQKDFNFNPSFRDPFTGGIKSHVFENNWSEIFF